MSIVSSASITHYREEGYCLIPNLIPQTSIEAARQRASEIGQQLAPWPSRHFQVLDPERYLSESDTPLPAGIQQPASQEAALPMSPTTPTCRRPWQPQAEVKSSVLLIRLV